MAAYGDDEAKVLKARTKYMRSPVVLVVASAVGHSDNETEENRYAVAAGIQNMLLMAESFGLSALWGSPAKGTNDAVTNLCSMASTDHVLGIIYVGWPTQSVPQVDRPDINITYLQ
jgi:nitroreductase